MPILHIGIRSEHELDVMVLFYVFMLAVGFSAFKLGNREWLGGLAVIAVIVEIVLVVLEEVVLCQVGVDPNEVTPLDLLGGKDFRVVDLWALNLVQGMKLLRQLVIHPQNVIPLHLQPEVVRVVDLVRYLVAVIECHCGLQRQLLLHHRQHRVIKPEGLWQVVLAEGPRYHDLVAVLDIENEQLPRQLYPPQTRHYERNSSDGMHRGRHLVIQYDIAFHLFEFLHSGELFFVELLVYFDLVFANAAVADVYVFEDVAGVVLVVNEFGEDAEVGHLLILIDGVIRIAFGLIDFGVDLFLKPLLREFVIIELLNVNQEPLNAWYVHLLKDLLVPQLLVQTDIRDLLRFDKFLKRFKNPVVDKFNYSVALLEGQETYLGPPSHDRVLEKDFAEHLVLIDPIDFFRSGCAYNASSL